MKKKDKSSNRISVRFARKYILYYYTKVDKCFKLLINIYDLLIIYDIKIKQILLPKPININLTTIYWRSTKVIMNG